MPGTADIARAFPLDWLARPLGLSPLVFPHLFRAARMLT